MYSLVKHLEEQMAIEMARWDPTLKIIALRFSNVMDPEDYAEFPDFDADATLRRWNLWGYIDGRDGTQAPAQPRLRFGTSIRTARRREADAAGRWGCDPRHGKRRPLRCPARPVPAARPGNG
jgi:hypothetical protein